MRTKGEVLITATYGPNGKMKWDKRPFLYCVSRIENWTDIENREYELNKRELNKQWIVNYWAEKLNTKSPPTNVEWARPKISLYFARTAYDRGNDKAAIFYLDQGVQRYNHMNRKYIAYMEGLRGGAKRAITIIKITNVVLSAGIGGSAALASKSILHGAKVVAGSTFVEKSALEIGKRLYGDKNKIDAAGIVKDTVGAFVGSLIGGKLSSVMLAQIQIRVLSQQGVTATMKTLPQVLKDYGQVGILLAGATNSQKFLTGFFMRGGTKVVNGWVLNASKKNKSKKMSTDDFVGEVVREIPEKKLDELQRRGAKHFR